MYTSIRELIIQNPRWLGIFCYMCILPDSALNYMHLSPLTRLTSTDDRTGSPIALKVVVDTAAGAYKVLKSFVFSSINQRISRHQELLSAVRALSDNSRRWLLSCLIYYSMRVTLTPGGSWLIAAVFQFADMFISHSLSKNR